MGQSADKLISQKGVTDNINSAKAMNTAVGKGSTNNANALPNDGWYLCSTNIPEDVGNFVYVLQVSYMKDVMVMQMAFPYTPPLSTNGQYNSASAPLYFRFKTGNYVDSPGWQVWKPIEVGNPNSRGSENDANYLLYDGWWLCKTNIPTSQFGQGNSYCYILQQTYGVRKLQIAVPYVSSGYRSLAFRGYHNDAWTNWESLLTPTNLAAQIATTLSNSTTITKIGMIQNQFIWAYGSGDMGLTAKYFTFHTPAGVGAPIYGGAYTNQSTRKSKKNIEDLTIAQAKKLLSLEPIIYEVKDDESGNKHYGLIAEDVDKIDSIPVSRIDDEIIGIDYQSLVAPLIKLIQEQDKRITELENQLSKL